MPTRTAIFALLLSAICGDFVVEAAPPRENAADLYEQVFKLVASLPESVNETVNNDYSDIRPDTLTNDHVNVLKKTDAVFALMARADAIKHCAFDIEDSDPITAPMPWLDYASTVRMIAKIAAVRSVCHVRDGRPRDAINELVHAGNLGRRIGHSNILLLALVGVSCDSLVYQQIARLAPDLSKTNLAYTKQALLERPAVVPCSALVRHERKRLVNWLRGEYLERIDHYTDKMVDGFEKMHAFFSVVLDESEPFDARHLRRIAELAKTSRKQYHVFLDEFNSKLTEAEKVADLHYAEAEKKWPKALLPEKTNNPFFQGLGIYLFDPLLSARRTLWRAQVSESMTIAGLEYLRTGQAALLKTLEPETGKRFSFEKSQTGFKLTSPTKRHEDDNWSVEFGWPARDLDIDP